MKKEIIISDKFQTQLEELNIVEQLQHKGTTNYPGSILKLEEGLYLLKDDQGQDVCGILDCDSFMEALMDTDISHLWAYDNCKKIGTAN